MHLKFCLFVFLFLLVGKSEATNGSSDFPNIIIFIADDVSARDIGAYGNSFVHTPNINSLAQKGIKFTSAILTTSSCSPSRTSIMTGRYPHNTGAAELHTEPDVSFPSIASQLKKLGYYTGQAGKWHMGNLLREGFDQIFDDRKQNGVGGEEMWIPSLQKRDKNKPFFFWFASYDAHRPWEVNKFSGTHDPGEIVVPLTLIDDDSTRMDLTQYYDEVKRWDFFVGEVIKELKRQEAYDNTLIIVMSDNGRPFPRDKTRMYDSGLRTPFILHWPNRIENSNISSSLISAVDIAPTIMDICGADIPETFQGKSFKKLIENPGKSFRNYAFAEHNWHDHEAHERMVRTSEYLYILNFRPELSNQGPADAINSPTFRSLLNAEKDGKLTSAQSDIFLAPRPSEELYKLKNDSFQIFDLINREEHKQIRLELNQILESWMKETCDNVPEQLTKDWYTRDTGKRIEENFRIRGEMPGQARNAEKCNAKGPF